MIRAGWMTQVICVACELDLPDLMEGHARTSLEIAQLAGCDAGTLNRLLRALTAMGLCSERDGRVFELTDMGLLLVSTHEGRPRASAVWWGRYLWPVWQDLRGSIESGRSVQERQTGRSGDPHLEQNPSAASVFNESMTEISRYVAEAALAKYDFSRVRQVVDVGGGYGEFLFKFLATNRSACGVLYDLPHAIDVASSRWAGCVNAPCCRFLAGDFFQSVPSEADLYVLKDVLHNWADEQAQLILRQCRAAMCSASRLLLMERLLPETMSASRQNRSLARTDLNMLVDLGGRERTRAELEDLIDGAGLMACGFVDLPPQHMLIECVAK